MKFHSTLELGGKTATGFEVPADVVSSLGSGKRPAVTVTINGFTYRSTIAVLGGRFMIPVAAEVRQNTGIAAGDEVEVDIELDSAPREVNLPDDFAQALESDPAAKKYFESLSYSNKRGVVTPIQDAKSAETRQRRIEKTISNLREGRV